MPLFSNKFNPKPVPPRGIRCNIGHSPIKENLNDIKEITLNLDDKELKFIDGIWIEVSKKANCDDISRLLQKIKSLEEENNLNQIKIEVLLDLLAENASELDIK